MGKGREMKVRDLGDLPGPVAVYGGPVSNLQATRALMDVLDAEGIPPEWRVCTGDVAAYCADPGPVVALVRARGGAVLAGNCERQLAAGAAECGCGFADGSACDAMSGAWWERASAGMNEQARVWMAELPGALTFSHHGRRVAALHGGATDIVRFLWPSSEDAAFEEEIEALRRACGDVDVVLAGHCGIAFERVVGGVRWVNAGSVGMPPHDGRPKTRWAVLDGDGVRFRRLSYDHEAAASAMEAAGLVQGYQRTLRSGIWPSQDVLPPELRR